MPKKELIDIDVFIHSRTEKAWLVSLDDGKDKLDPNCKKVWLAKSLVEHPKGNAFGPATITLPTWLAEEKELV